MNADADPGESFYRYPETPSQMAYARGEPQPQEQGQSQKIDRTGLAFDAQGNPVQLFDQQGRPLTFDPATRAFYDEMGVPVHVDLQGTGMLFDHLGQPLQLATSTNLQPITAISDPYLAQLHEQGMEVIRIQMEKQNAIAGGTRPVAAVDLKLLNEQRRKRLIVIYVFVAIVLMVGVTIPILYAVGVMTPKNDIHQDAPAPTGSGGSGGSGNNGANATMTTWQFRNNVGLCMAVRDKGYAALEAVACETAPVMGQSLQLWNTTFNVKTNLTDVIHATVNKYLCINDHIPIVGTPSTSTPTPSSDAPGAPLGCTSDFYRVSVDFNTSTLAYHTLNADKGSICVDVNLQLEDSYDTSVCDPSQTWTPIQPGTASSVPLPAQVQSYQLQSYKGCATVNDTQVIPVACDPPTSVTVSQAWHLVDSIKRNTITGVLDPNQIIFHTSTGKRLCYGSSTMSLGSSSGKVDYCDSYGGVSFLPAKSGGASNATTGGAGGGVQGTLTIPKLGDADCVHADGTMWGYFGLETERVRCVDACARGVVGRVGDAWSVFDLGAGVGREHNLDGDDKRDDDDNCGLRRSHFSPFFI
ncbi:hypothetical protein HK101_003743 [Irineochytrium annulatum]|nr:hypothetical protein HK101_003743 [Irineochytrium annulatum]